MEEVRARHRTANHNVYAYLLRQGGRTRYSDDGEPQKTAGLPVLEVLRHSGLTDLIVVVTRYFGGTLLGTGGLVRAYTTAAQAALERAHRVTVRPCVDMSAVLPYALYEQGARLARRSGRQGAGHPFHRRGDTGADTAAGRGAAAGEALRALPGQAARPGGRALLRPL